MGNLILFRKTLYIYMWYTVESENFVKTYGGVSWECSVDTNFVRCKNHRMDLCCTIEKYCRKGEKDEKIINKKVLNIINL